MPGSVTFGCFFVEKSRLRAYTRIKKLKEELGICGENRKEGESG